MSIQIRLFISPGILVSLIPCNLFFNALESVRMLSLHSTLPETVGLVFFHPVTLLYIELNGLILQLNYFLLNPAMLS